MKKKQIDYKKIYMINLLIMILGLAYTIALSTDNLGVFFFNWTVSAGILILISFLIPNFIANLINRWKK